MMTGAARGVNRGKRALPFVLSHLEIANIYFNIVYW